jgi:hypothetical protein
MANYKILNPVEIKGVVIDPAGASNLQVLQYRTDQGKFVPQTIEVGGAGGGGDEGTIAMVSAWMAGSN